MTINVLLMINNLHSLKFQPHSSVMALVKFSQMQPQTLLGLMNDKNLDNNKECRAFLKRALDYLHSGKQHGQMMSDWITPRASTGCLENKCLNVLNLCLPKTRLFYTKSHSFFRNSGEYHLLAWRRKHPRRKYQRHRFQRFPMWDLCVICALFVQVHSRLWADSWVQTY